MPACPLCVLFLIQQLALGDLYLLDGTGRILQHIVLPGYPVNFAMCDVTDNGLEELLVVINEIPGSLALYKTRSRATQDDWPTLFGSAKRDGTMGTSE